jgi:hypothetical protein
MHSAGDKSIATNVLRDRGVSTTLLPSVTNMRQNDCMEDQHASTTAARYAFGLTEVEVRRLQDIMRRECGVELTLEAAWARAIELLALFRMMLGPIPEDSRPRGSNIGAIDENRSLSN